VNNEDMEENNGGLTEVISRYLPVRTKEIYKGPQEEIQCPDKNLNLAPHKYKAEYHQLS
jgi:hypothetical protein